MNIDLNSNLEPVEKRLLHLCSGKDLEQLARCCGFYKRTFRKISPIAFVQGLSRATLTAFPSLNIIAGTIAAVTGNLVSKQALSKRIQAPAVSFLTQLLRMAIAHPIHIDMKQIDQLLTAFSSVWISDSTTIKLHPSLAQFFPGSRNQTKKQSAILRIQLSLDLRSGLLDGIGLSPYTRNDQKASPDIFAIAKKGHLVIRDLGYFSLKVFAQMIQKGIFFISRIPYGVSLFDAKLKPIHLLKILKKNKTAFDRELVVGAEEKLTLRVVAIPVPEKEIKKRTQKAKKDCRANHSKEYMELLGWTIFVTNIPDTLLPTHLIYSIYAIRWKIEIIFKIWKSFFRIVEIPKASVCYVQCLVYAKLILVVLINHSQIVISTAVNQKYEQSISPMKFAQFISQPILKLFSPIDPEKWNFSLLEFVNYYCSYEKRTRINMADCMAKLIPINEMH